MKLVELAQVSKSFQQGAHLHKVLKDVDLSIEEGDFIAICGPSGHGKSTLLSIMALLDQVTSGSYRLAGKDVAELNSDERALLRGRHIGMIFQSFNLIGDMTVAENIQLPLRFAGHIEKHQHAECVAAAIAAVGLSDKAGFYPDMLSGGQQQRVAIARAIVHQPDIVFADEPTGNLDPQTAESVMTLLKSLNSSGVTLCLVTHDNNIASTANRVVTMTDGQLASI